MIQRVQTLWMILASLFVFLTLKFSFYSGTLVLGSDLNTINNLATDGLYHVVKATDNLILLILTSALGTIIIINIFLFKQRSLQIRIIIAAILMEILILFLYIRETNQYTQGNFSIWAGLHILVIICLFFAAKGIYHDSKLIKESNRLR